MRTIDSSILVLKPSNFAWWHRSWTGRFVLAALLIAAAAFALMPDRTSAHQSVGDTIEVHCKAQTDNGGTIPAEDVNGGFGVIPGNIFNKGLQSDCIALLTAAEMLNDVGNDYDWIVTGDGQHSSFNGVVIGFWDGVTVEDVDHDDDDTTPEVMRVTEVSLTNGELTGTLADAWADLDELIALEISGHSFEDNAVTTDVDESHDGLTGSPSRSLWAFLSGLETLDLSGNPDLAPSPALNLTAKVTKGEAGTDVALDWDDIGWYTNSEGADTIHTYQYCKLSICASSDWEAADVTFTDAAGTSTAADMKGDRVKLELADLDAANNTHVFRVQAVKTDDGGTLAETEDDTVTRSEISQIDVVGPQTLTADNMYSLPVAVAYTAALSSDEAKLTVTAPDADADTFLLMFNPLEETEALSPVTVTLDAPTGATSGSHTFPVKVLSADSAPTVTVSRIPNREVVNQRRATRIDLSRYFPDDALTFTVTSSKTNVATVEEIDGWLHITTVREGRTDITVTAENPDHGKVSREFRVTVVSPNNAPQLIGNIPDLTLYLDDAGTQVDMTPFFRDQDNEFLRFIPQSSNPMVVTATSVGRNVIFNVNGLGEITMTIIAQDGAGATAFGSFKVTVLDPNAAPQAVGVIPPQTIRVGDEGLALSLGDYFTDANNDPLTYRAVSADTSILTVEVTEAVVTLTAVVVGETTVTVTATDTGGKSATQTIVVVVLPANRPPEVTGQIPDQTLQYNDEPLGLDVTMYFTDPDGDVLSYVGEGTDEAVAEVRVHSDGLVRIDPISHGEIEVTVTARDPLGASVSQSFMVMVQGNLPPEAVGVIDDQVLLEGGRAVTINVSGYFSDPNGDELTYMATSSNADAVQAVVIDGSSELVLRPLAPAEDVTVTVTAMDPEGETAAQLVMVTVAAAAPPPTATPAPTATPEPTAPPPPPTATPAPTATFVPTDGGGGFPVGLIIVLLLVLAGVAAAVFIIQRRR